MMNFMNLYCGVCFFPQLTSPTAKPLVPFCLMFEEIRVQWMGGDQSPQFSPILLPHPSPR